MPWLETPTALLPLWMFNNDGTPFASEPRHALNQVLARYAKHRLTPITALEIAFYLIDVSGVEPQIPRAPLARQHHPTADTLSVRALDDFDSFLTDLYAACEAMDVPANTTISESGVGQYEFNLLLCENALLCADHAWLFKRAAKGIACKHGFTASFMAKPY